MSVLGDLDELIFVDDRQILTEGPRFSDGSFTREEYEERQAWEKFRERRNKFRESLDSLYKIFSSRSGMTESLDEIEGVVQTLLDKFPQ